MIHNESRYGMCLEFNFFCDLMRINDSKHSDMSTQVITIKCLQSIHIY